jgi:hypothetical protein
MEGPAAQLSPSYFSYLLKGRREGGTQGWKEGMRKEKKKGEREGRKASSSKKSFHKTQKAETVHVASCSLIPFPTSFFFSEYSFLSDTLSVYLFLIHQILSPLQNEEKEFSFFTTHYQSPSRCSVNIY